MYSKYFGLSEPPFSIAPDPRYLYLSERHREALAHLVYGINTNGGFVLLTGEVGTGKTTVCRCLLEQLPQNADIAFILNPKLTVMELLATVCDEFGVHYSKGSTSFKEFVDSINTYLLDAHARGRTTVLIIDEAQNLSIDVLEQIRLLTNLETNQRKLLRIILLGQPELKVMLSQPALRQLAQRITARYHLGPLSKKEVAAYITHRLAVAGLYGRLFPTSTISQLFRLSGGIPRLINVLCDRALLGVYVQGRSRVDKATLAQAAREVFGEAKAQQFLRRKASSWLLGSVVLVGGGVALAAAYHNYGPELVAMKLPEWVPQDALHEVVREEPVHHTVNEEPRAQVAEEKPIRQIVKEETIPQDVVRGPALEVVEGEDVPELTKERFQLATLQWPANQPTSRSNLMAYQALFKRWKLTYQPQKNGTVCQYARAQGLRCLSNLGSLGILRQLNRPAVLKLLNAQGQEFYAALLSLGREAATFVIGTETRVVAVEEIALWWHGHYTLLWRVPPHYQGHMHPGDRGFAVQWLDKKLALLQGRAAQSKKNLIYDQELVRQVKEFQLGEGLSPDGIVGPHTLIHLNTATGRAVPRLIDEWEDS